MPSPLVHALGIVSLAAALAGGAHGQTPPDLNARLDALFARTVSGDTPGCALGVRQGKMSVERAWGSADLERGVALTPQSVFNIGSAAKQVTAMAVLLLEREGKLKLHDDVRRFLPELPERSPVITIDDLLYHRSGTRDFRMTDGFLGRDVLATSNADVLAYAARQRALDYPPGTSHHYSNTGYVLLALIVERASGQPFAEFTTQHLFTPAGMTQTRWEDDAGRVVPQRAVGYRLAEPANGDTPARFEQLPSARRTIGNGGLLSTTGDMLRWNAALSRNAFGPGLSARLEERGRLHNGTQLDYARGLFVDEYRGLREVQHGGYTGSYTAWVGRYPQADLSIALLCNGDADEVSGHAIADLFLPASRTSAPEAAAKQAQKDLSAHSGLYRNADTGDLAMFEFPADAALSDGRYVNGPLQYEFDDKRSDQLRRFHYGNVTTWVLVPASTAAGAPAEYAGDYQSDELLGGYQVRTQGDRLTISVRGLSTITVPLRPLAPDIFLAEGIQMPIGFARGAGGKVVALTLYPQLVSGLPFRRIPAQD